jgi:23S rRNA pseudouridine955/2504/2580 synthase/23S rRNA pseudouridine1911/1915/1917 synthase
MSRARSRFREWIIEDEGPRTIDEVLAALDDPDALEQGRVFVAGRRAAADQVLETGERVVVYAPRGLGAAPVVLCSHEGFVVAQKPPELATEPDRAGTVTSLRHLLAEQLGVPERELHALSRLDVGVSGAVLFARSPEARRRRVEHRSYLGLALSAPSPESGSWCTPVDGKDALTRYAVAARARVPIRGGAPVLLVLRPQTGRLHQLRVHAAAAGTPLLGDRAHGGPRKLVASDGRVVPIARVALHALRVVIPGGPAVIAPVPRDLGELWAALGGSTADFERAERMACGKDP